MRLDRWPLTVVIASTAVATVADCAAPGPETDGSTIALGIPGAIRLLRTATSNPARWFRRDDFATAEPGKRADLILVDGDGRQELLSQNGSLYMCAGDLRMST